MQVQNQPVPTMEKNAVSQQKDIKSGKMGKQETQTKDTAKTEQSTEPKSPAENTSVYLKVLSRLENMLKTEEVPEKAVEGF